MKKPHGLLPPVITIFDEKGHPNHAAMKRHADFLIDNGVDGLVYLGTSGEFSLMSQEDKVSLIRELVPYAKDRVSVVVGISDTCLENTLELAHEAEVAGADAVLALVPYFSIYAEENVYSYYSALADSVHLPLILYNFPALTGFDITASLVRRLLAEHPNVCGIKDTVDDQDHLLSMIALKKEFPDFSVFCAYETQAMPIIRSGADGMVNATANFAPQITASFLKELGCQNISAAEHNWEKMCDAAQVYTYATPLLLAVKEAVYQILPDCRGYEKLPGLPLFPSSAQAIEGIVHTL